MVVKIRKIKSKREYEETLKKEFEWPCLFDMHPNIIKVKDYILSEKSIIK